LERVDAGQQEQKEDEGGAIVAQSSGVHGVVSEGNQERKGGTFLFHSRWRRFRRVKFLPGMLVKSSGKSESGTASALDFIVPMAKPPSSAIGIDVGRHSMKAVLLQRRGSSRLVLTHFAVKEIPEGENALEKLEENLRTLMCELGGSAKACGIAVSSPDALVRIIEQNTIPPELLRDALRINGPLLLSQDCRDWVIDCEAVSSNQPAAPAPGDAAAVPDRAAMVHYLVGGLPREQVAKVYDACTKNKLPATVFQLPPVALLNAFEYANESVFQKEAFVLADIGHRASTVIMGAKGELVFIRTLDYGGAHFAEQLILQGASSFEEVTTFLEQEEVLTVENARLSLGELVHSISSSIGFFEAQREEDIPRVYVSGGLAKLPAVLKVLSEELHLPCETWDPLAAVELNLPKMRIAALGPCLPVLGTACGVAMEILKGR